MLNFFEKLAFIVCAACLGACSAQNAAAPPPKATFLPQSVTPPAATQADLPHVSPFLEVNVTGVQVRVLESDPKQVELAIQGTLPDQCNYRHQVLDKRNEKEVHVTWIAIHPNQQCENVSQAVEYTILLGANQPEQERRFPPGTYKLVINQYQTFFEITE